MVDPVGAWRHAEKRPTAYGASSSYRLGMEWLEPCSLVEDWGCGKGYARTLRDFGYRGLDGSPGRFVDEVVDLRTYRSSAPGIFMRHVLEHNHEWRQILEGAAASFTERLALIVFTPLVDETKQIATVPPGVPDYAFALEDLLEPLEGHVESVETIDSPETAYGTETVVLCER